jgi:hypothetical protein
MDAPVAKGSAAHEIPHDLLGVLGILTANAEKNFVQRIMFHREAPKLYDGPLGELGKASTHSMAWGEDAEGNAYVYPTVIQKKDGSLVRLKPDEADQYARKSGELIHFGKNKKTAEWFSSDKGYNQVWEHLP